MAIARTITHKEQVIKTVDVIDSVNLSLSIQEAEVLLQILNKIGGHPEKTARKFVCDILEALDEAEIEPSNHNLTDEVNTIYFAQ